MSRVSSPSQRGLTLVELMVGIAVALLLLALISQIFLSAKNSFRFQSANARIQENTRFLTDTLIREVRESGHQGCGSGVLGFANVVAGGTGNWWARMDLMGSGTPLSPIEIDSIRGFDGDGTTTFPTQFTGRITDNAFGAAKPDALVVLYADPASERTITAYDGGAHAFTTGTAHGYREGEILVAWDGCHHAAVFQMTNNAGSGSDRIEHVKTTSPVPGNCKEGLKFGDCNSAFPYHSGDVNYSFSAGNSIARLVAKGYYVAPASDATDGTRSLWVSTWPSTTPTTGQPEVIELVRGVQNMQVLYGIESTANPYTVLRYLPADDVGANDWHRIIAVRIELLLRSEETGIATERMTVPFNGANYQATAGDLRLYRPYSVTINLRNRVK